MAAMAACDSIYFDRVSRIRMERWSERRLAFVGDAAFCPPPRVSRARLPKERAIAGDTAMGAGCLHSRSVDASQYSSRLSTSDLFMKMSHSLIVVLPNPRGSV